MYSIKQYTFLLILLCISTTGSVSAGVKSHLPEIVTLEWQGLQLVGQTTLRRFGFHIYDASLWEIKDKPENALDINTRALCITYARNIRASQLLYSTKKEWERLGFADQYPVEAWLTMLKNIWPDVNAGDQLVFVTSPKGKSYFYNNRNTIGTIEDSAFGPAFLAIWLDKNSRYKKNRKELLGE